MLYALESIFLIRLLPIEGGTKGHVCILEDQAEAKSLVQNKAGSVPFEMEGLIYRNIRLQFHYQLGKSFRFFHFRSRSGAQVPLAVENQDGILGIIAIKSHRPTRSESASAASFLKKYSRSKILYLCADKQIHQVDDRSLILPITSVL